MRRRFIINLFILLVSVLALSSPIRAIAAASIKQPNFLILSDIHLNTSTKTPMVFSPNNPSPKSPRLNEIDLITFKAMLQETQQEIKTGLIQNPDFILISGDLSGHNRDDQNSTYNNQKMAFKLLRNAFPDKPLIYAFGNNDSLEKSFGTFYFSTNTNLKKAHSPFEIAINSGWKNGFLSSGINCDLKRQVYPCLINENRTLGYYSLYLYPKLKLIALNSDMFSADKRNTSQMDFADEQLKWLYNEVETSHKNNEEILLVSHIPMGRDILDNAMFWQPKYQDSMYKILSSFSNDIIAILSGHTHMEELKIIEKAAGNSHNNTSNIVIITPSFSTSDGNAPAIKTIYLQNNSHRWFVSNYETFSFALNNKLIIAKKLYDFNYFYCNNAKENADIKQCLNKVTSEKIFSYLTSGNINYRGAINYPDNIFIRLP